MSERDSPLSPARWMCRCARIPPGWWWWGKCSASCRAAPPECLREQPEVGGAPARTWQKHRYGPRTTCGHAAPPLPWVQAAGSRPPCPTAAGINARCSRAFLSLSPSPPRPVAFLAKQRGTAVLSHCMPLFRNAVLSEV